MKLIEGALEKKMGRLRDAGVMIYMDQHEWDRISP